MSLAMNGAPDARATGVVPVGLLALPVAVRTAGLAVAVEDELRILIACPEMHLTMHLRVLSTKRIESLPALPIVAAGATLCRGTLVVTGADRTGAASIIGLARDGAKAWQVTLTGPQPIRWPRPFCMLQPAIVWQTEASWLEAASVGSGTLTSRRRFPVGGPPLSFAAADGSLWAAWGDRSGTRVAEINATGTLLVEIASDAADQVAMGAHGKRASVAWTKSRSSFLANLKDGKLAGSTTRIELAQATGGNLVVLPGPAPLVWAQHGRAIEGEVPHWVSALVRPGWQPVLIEGLVHTVAWWGDKLAVIGSEELWLLQTVANRQSETR
jgi:hypothetical protein